MEPTDLAEYLDKKKSTISQHMTGRERA